MTLNELIEDIKALALSHDQVQAFFVGETFEKATSKSSEKYPVIWLEIPIATDYVDRRKKVHTMALYALAESKEDDITDAIYKASDMEVVMDELLQAIDDKFQNIGLSDLTAFTMREYTDDYLAGVRCDVSFTVGRECDYKESFDTTF